MDNLSPLDVQVMQLLRDAEDKNDARLISLDTLTAFVKRYNDVQSSVNRLQSDFNETKTQKENLEGILNHAQSKILGTLVSLSQYGLAETRREREDRIFAALASLAKTYSEIKTFIYDGYSTPF
jgi:hypothetical protein